MNLEAYKLKQNKQDKIKKEKEGLARYITGDPAGIPLARIQARINQTGWVAGALARTAEAGWVAGAQTCLACMVACVQAGSITGIQARIPAGPSFAGVVAGI